MGPFRFVPTSPETLWFGVFYYIFAWFFNIREPRPASRGFSRGGRAQSAILNLQWKGVVTMKVVKIRGRNRIDVKKRVLDYYFCNRDQLGESLKQFFKRCIIDPDGKTVIIRGQWWTHPTQVTNGRRKGMEARLYPLPSFLAFHPCQASTQPAEILPLSTQL
jgi:hypothetical protein